MIIKNKKGEGLLESETVKIVIAVICIAFLVYFSYLVYQVAREKNEGRQAKSSLEDIALRFEKMEVSSSATYLYLAPENYYFKVSDENNKIDQCATKYCLCLCDEKDCSDFNICRKTDKMVIIGALEGIKVDAPVSYTLINDLEFYRINLADDNQK